MGLQGRKILLSLISRWAWSTWIHLLDIAGLRDGGDDSPVQVVVPVLLAPWWPHGAGAGPTAGLGDTPQTAEKPLKTSNAVGWEM